MQESLEQTWLMVQGGPGQCAQRETPGFDVLVVVGLERGWWLSMEVMESPPPSVLGGLGVSSQIVPAMCVPRLAKATEGRWNQEGKACWSRAGRAGVSHSLESFPNQF